MVGVDLLTGFRDFTINALYFDPMEHTILDFVGGLEFDGRGGWTQDGD